MPARQQYDSIGFGTAVLACVAEMMSMSCLLILHAVSLQRLDLTQFKCVTLKAMNSALFPHCSIPGVEEIH